MLEASGVGEIQEILRKHYKAIHLLVIEVTMSKMLGRELTQKVLELLPETKVIFTSSYTEACATAEGLMEPGGTFVQKPFTILSLASKIRAFLDTTTPTGGGQRGIMRWREKTRDADVSCIRPSFDTTRWCDLTRSN